MAILTQVLELASSVAAAQPRFLQRLRALVEVESPSDDKAAVDRAGLLVTGWAEALGAQVKCHKQKHFGDVLELHFGPRSSIKPILLLGHLDTVWPIGTLAQMPWREADGKLYGPGVVDMKAGVVMALEAISAAQTFATRSGTQLRPVTLLVVSDEEIGSPVSRAITEKIAAKCVAVFVLEPAQGLAYKTARKGVGHYEIHIRGVGAHAGVDFTSGHSAVREAAKLVETISSFTDLRIGRSVNVGVIQGGTLSNVVAAECRLEVDVRIAKAADGPRIDRLLRSLKVTDKACTLTVTGGINRPPMERRPGTVALFKQARSLGEQLGITLEEAATGGGSDGNFTAALGIPTLDGMGAVGGGAHAANEHVISSYLVERTALLAAMILSV